MRQCVYGANTGDWRSSSARFFSPRRRWRRPLMDNGCQLLAMIPRSSPRSFSFSPRYSPAFRSASSCCWRPLFISGRAARRRCWCCRKPWSPALGITFSSRFPFSSSQGLVMERGGISVRLIRFVHALVGHLRGGLLQVAVVSMYVISGLSGSKPADVAAVGTIMRDEVSARHGAPEGAAVLAVSAIMGETVPPSIAMLIVGSITNVSVAGMFIGGLMPAAVIALCLMALIAVRARRAGAVSAPRAPLRAVARAGFNAILPLLMPGMLLAGILLGLATPTEIAALAVVYGVTLAMFVYREMTVAGFLRAVQDTAALTGVLLFIFTAARS